jgi:hypothetical protein
MTLMQVDNDIAMNDALAENLFVTIIALLNKLPCMYVIGSGHLSADLLTIVAMQDCWQARFIKDFSSSSTSTRVEFHLMLICTKL